ncbi:MAG TPA: hypothetical protein VMH35_17100 [Streptosporangiaceae bacterium]|nr:hypothetical protein [Streptosporangiaceae bacterium]
MSLPARQQRTLDRIERKLIASDPVLHSWFSIFARLTRDEEMPQAEEVRARLARFSGWLARRAAPVRRHIPRPSARAKAILFFPAALAAMVGTLLIGASGPAMQRCPASVRVPTAELVVKARQCRLNGLHGLHGLNRLNRLTLAHAPLFGH